MNIETKPLIVDVAISFLEDLLTTIEVPDYSVIQIGRHPRGNIPEDRWKRVKLALYNCNVYRITFSSAKESLELRDEVSPWGGDLLIAFNNRWDENPNAPK